MARVAVVLFNLGGPDGPEAVRPFLYNLFSDPAIIGVPAPIRQVIAATIAWRRAPVAREIYRNLGGGSPLLANTEAQARALERELGTDYRAFIAMRYWHPRSPATAAAVKSWGADEVVLLPLYPQFSTTTTASSLADWQRAAAAVGLRAPARTVCCYPALEGFVAAMATLIRTRLEEAAELGRPRLLLTAHGLPEKIVAGGDPYQWQVEQTAAAIVAALAVPELDWRVCYQSRVGPLAWIGPATDEEVRRAGQDRVPVVMAPIAFVSEHSETLVELDIEYRHLAEECGVPGYLRVPTVGVEAAFIEGVASVVRSAQDWPPDAIAPASGRRLCPATHGRCACAEA